MFWEGGSRPIFGISAGKAAHNIPLSNVDSMLGWKQTEHRLNMQEHYDEDDLRARMEVARITAH